MTLLVAEIAGVILVLGAVGVWPREPSLASSARRPLRATAFQWGRSDPAGECLVVLDALVATLRSGSPAGTAVALAVAPFARGTGFTAAGWHRLRDRAQRDDALAEVWRELGEAWNVTAFADVAAAWQMSERHGCPLADAMESAASGVRETRRHAGAVDAAVSGAHATMGVLALLPLLGIGLGYLLGVDMLSYYRGSTGLLTVWPGLGLMYLGLRWTRRMVTKALRPPESNLVAAA